MPKIITSNSSSSGASEFQQLNVDWESTRGVTEILNKPKNVTTTKDGFMSKEDKIKLNGVTAPPTKLSQLVKDINFDERYYTETEIDAKLGGKVDNSRVLTDVPLNAKFTDTNTTYSEITTAEIDLGTASTSRVITARRVKYILDKVGGMISTAIGALTKSSVGLGNVDNTSDISKPISTATQTALDDKVNNSQVLTNVPIGAKFTDTNTITTINGKTGAIAKADIVALGIPTSDTNTTYTAGAGLILTGTVFTPNFGTTAGTITQGNDSRLSNARTPLAHNHLKSDITDFPLLATVATSGSYNDLASKPTIPTNTTQLTKGDVYTKTEVNGLLSDAGLGDMLKSVYDTNGNGIVDNAEKVNGFTLGINVPSNAKFTDTIYSHPSTHPASMIAGLEDIVIDGGTF